MAEAVLENQLKELEGFAGNLFFVAGNRDWKDYGVEGLRRQRKFIEDYLDRKDIWEPNCGCGDPKEIDLNDDLVLILITYSFLLIFLLY